MAHHPLPYGRQSLDETDIDAVVEVLRGDWLTQGPSVRAFEQALCDKTGARHAVALANGTAALHLAAQAAGVEPGTIAITPAITFLSSANCIRFCGGAVAFCDVDPRTGLIDVESLDALVTELERGGHAPRAIVPVDMCGQPADVPAVAGIARRVGARVIVDAAHSLGASYEVGCETVRVGAGRHADMTTFSFHPIKHITTGEGGAVMTDDAQLAGVLESLRSHGMHRDPERLTRDASDPFAGPWYYEQDRIGYNYRITDFQCALGLSQLGKLERFVVRRRALAHRYDQILAERFAGVLEPLHQFPDRVNAYHLYVARLVAQPGEAPEQVAQRRKDLFVFLRERGILAQVNYIPVPWQPAHGGAAPDAFPGALAYYAGCISLPLFPAMHDDDIDQVVDALAAWHGAGG